MWLNICCAGVAMYQWACTEPDESGQRYIPSVRDRDALTVDTAGEELNIYSLPKNLCEACYGRVVEIEYCYRYNNMMAGPAVFNWTVLILKQQSISQSSLTIRDIIAIESHSNSTNCTESGMCCDVTGVNRNLKLSRDFAFGVTGPSQGNTHSASLLGFHESQTQYRVNTTQISISGQTLLVCSRIHNAPVVQRGLHMLWFVLGTSLI